MARGVGLGVDERFQARVTETGAFSMISHLTGGCCCREFFLLERVPTSAPHTALSHLREWQHSLLSPPCHARGRAGGGVGKSTPILVDIARQGSHVHPMHAIIAPPQHLAPSVVQKPPERGMKVVMEEERRYFDGRRLLQVAPTSGRRVSSADFTCSRRLFRTDTNDLTGGVRRGKKAMVISHLLCK